MVKALSDHELSVCEWGDDYSLYGIDRVIHLGAISDTRCQDWAALSKQNVSFSLALIARCQERGIPIQVASSASVYGPNNTTFNETDSVEPANMYAKSKALIEEFVKSLTPKAPIQVFRYFNVTARMRTIRENKHPHSTSLGNRQRQVKLSYLRAVRTSNGTSYMLTKLLKYTSSFLILPCQVFGMSALARPFRLKTLLA